MNNFKSQAWQGNLLVCVGLLLALISCEGKKPASSSAASSANHTVQDDLGRDVTLPVHPQRIIGLAPSMTEMLFAVADTATIVGRTQNDDYPDAALSKPVVNNYPMDYEGLLALKPEVVFAPEGIISTEVATQIQKLGIPVYFQKYDSVADILRGIRDLGKLLQREAQANALADSLRQRLDAFASEAQEMQKPKVLGIIWRDPIYVHGYNTIFSDKLRYAGGQNAVQEVFAQQSPALTREYILQLNPDVIIGGTFEEFDQNFFTLYPELKRINAYKNKRIYDVTDDLISRPSPRVVQSIAELKNVLR
ncbi:ABC transporter substrate-binding protein [Rufibacter roseus]|uniref:ABC transporter substrate-binding protein n=1 Tax=Rufibacter roseus TaxID=1567108 RepID=A0ABW2DNH9_9BACT|nr:helical backbone metal receptor [Rufibacter roseus]